MDVRDWEDGRDGDRGGAEDGCGVDVGESALMPAVSQAQRAFLFATKGAAWVKAHHFDNKGPLPARVARPHVLRDVYGHKNAR